MIGHGFEWPESGKFSIVRHEERWWGRPLLWLAAKLTDLAYFRAREVHSVFDMPIGPKDDSP